MKRNISGIFFICFLLLCMAGCDSSRSNSGSSHVNFLWKMDDVSIFTCTHMSGNKPTIVTDVIYQCNSSFKIIPVPNTSTYPETKIETTFDPNRNPYVFDKWINSNYVFIDIYVTAGSNLNNCFVYVWDDNKGWVDGIFYENKFNTGWNRVALPLTFTIKDLDKSRPEKYKIGFGFRHMAEGEEAYLKNGYSLNEVPIYIGGIGVY